jgi:hypothetical protein
MKHTRLAFRRCARRGSAETIWCVWTIRLLGKLVPRLRDPLDAPNPHQHGLRPILYASILGQPMVYGLRGIGKTLLVVGPIATGSFLARAETPSRVGYAGETPAAALQERMSVVGKERKVSSRLIRSNEAWITKMTSVLSRIVPVGSEHCH